jgi:hypothetical protein
VDAVDLASHLRKQVQDPMTHAWRKPPQAQATGKTPDKNTNAKYDAVAEAEAILAEDALQVPQLAGTSPLVSALAY